MTLDPGSQKGDAEDAEYTVIHDNDVEDLLQEDPYETIESLDDNDVENISQKDPYEKINVHEGGNPCSLYQSNTDYIDNRNIINFGSSIQGQANPFIIPVPKAVPSSITIRVEVYDNDGTSIDDHLDTFSKLINIKATATKETAMYTQYILRGRTELNIAVRAYCDTDWYGSTCEKYCKATTNHSHYRCRLQTGAKVCFEGWKGDNCDQDIDECKEIDNTCQNGGRCRNTLGSFECICIEGIKGRRCENIINQCAVAPCLNGGTCNGNETAFNCACSVEWTGETCAEKVNVCDSSPCNRGNCTSDLLTATRFKCNCDFAWVGERCSLYVDIVNITLLGEIDHTNRGDLADGMNRLITELGVIPGKVDIKFMTNSHTENNFTTTYVQFYSAVENGFFIESPFLDEIFESNPDEVINEYLPLPLYPPREEANANTKMTPAMPRIVVTDVL
ncbi:protein jagged-1-like [Haliotis rubra]|uniref:protein jagged-1-like n=1 Tax=Haliotis rubra TaxID=36100 RepID=UPI001EE52E84|nr:protein jagged-1-like [Haliotis rubra]